MMGNLSSPVLRGRGDGNITLLLDGKTQIAVEFAYRHRQKYQTVLWALADTRESLVSGYIAIAELLSLPEKDAQDHAIIFKAVMRWLTTNSGWLLILDNADELSLVREFIPTDFRGHLLLTTRAQSMGRLASRIEVEAMDQDGGALLLLRRVSLMVRDASLNSVLSSDVEIAREITKELGGLPLALDQAGAYIEETRCGLTNYLECYRKHRGSLLERRGGLVNDHPEPVATTWSLSFEKVERQSPVAGDLLRVCAFLAADTIPEEIFTQGAAHLGPHLSAVEGDPHFLDGAVAVLGSYSLIQREGKDKMLSLHRLVQAVLKDSMDEQIRRQWAVRAVEAVIAAFPYVTPSEWPHCGRLLPHALVCIALIKGMHLLTPDVAQLLNRTAYYLRERARYQEAESLLQEAVIIQESLLGPDHPHTALSLNDLAMLYEVQGKDKQAEPLFERALAIREQQLGLEHLDTSDSLKNLAMLYSDWGKYEQAEPLLKRALAIREQRLGPEDFRTAAVLNDLGSLSYAKGEDEQAESYWRQALAIREKQSDLQAPGTAIVLNNLARLYKKQGKYEQAEPLYKRSLEIHELRMGLEHPFTAHILSNLASLYLIQGKYGETEPLFQRARAIYEQVLGEEHPDTARSVWWLAVVYEQQQRYEEAEPLYHHVLSIFERALGPEHPDVEGMRRQYVSLLRILGRNEEADAIERQGHEEPG